MEIAKYVLGEFANKLIFILHQFAPDAMAIPSPG
jgi:hypothetical protein